MNLQINLNTPTPHILLKNPKKGQIADEFEQSGTWDEIFMLGQQVPLAAIEALKYQAVNPMDEWASLVLVHLHATLDHIILLDPKILIFTAEEEELLRSSVQEVLDTFLSNPVITTGTSWLFCTNEFSNLQTSSVELTNGRNIDVWMPKDTSKTGVARKWRQMQNEIQMIWHNHPVNLARYDRGELPINSVWLQGVGSLSQIHPHSLIKFSKELHGNSLTLANVAQFLNKPFHRLNAQAISELEAGSHFIDGRNHVSNELWESIWQACLKLLHQGQISHIQLTTELFGQTLTSKVQVSDFNLEVSALKNFFFKKRLIQQKFPSWGSFEAKIQWQQE